MHTSHLQLSFAALVVVLGAAACTQEPASVEFQGVPPTTIETMDAIPLPPVVVKDDKGEPLSEQPSVSWTSSPEGFVQVAGGTISPIKSGDVKLIARVKDTEVMLEQPIKVQLVDRIAITCEPESCRFAPGDRFRLRAQAKSGDTVIEGLSFDWSSDNRNIVDSKGGGEFEAVMAGFTKLQASARGVVATQNVTVESPVEQVIVICPNPPSAHVAPSGVTGARSSCVVQAGESMELAVEVRGLGKVMDRRVSWSSTNPTYVGVSGGRVMGVQEGAAIVEGRVENLLVSMPVEVRRAGGKCSGKYEERLQSTMDGAPALFACADQDAVRCLESAMAKAEKKKKPLSAVSQLAAAKKCCCADIPPLRKQVEEDAAASDAGPAAEASDGGQP